MLYAHILELDDHLNELSIREIDIADHLGEPLNSHFQSSMEPMKWAIGGKSTLDVLLNYGLGRYMTKYNTLLYIHIDLDNGFDHCPAQLL